MGAMRIEVRDARPADAETIHRFISELAAYEREPDAVEVTPAVLRAQMAERPPPFECLIAEADGEPVGFALFFHNYSTWRGARGLYLEDLWVTPAARRHGAGRALFEGLAAVAAARGCKRIDWSVLDWNSLAIDFYRGLGAHPMTGWTGFRLTGEPLARLATRAE